MKFWGTILAVCCCANLIGQAIPMPRQTSLLFGWHQCFLPNDPFSQNVSGPGTRTFYHLPTIALERTLMRYGSFQMGGGADMFSYPRNPTYIKLNVQVFAELRYYFLLQRGRPTSGIYIGLYADVNRLHWHYRQPRGIAVRRTFENGGPTIGYQHAWGKHFRFNEGVSAVIQSTIRENHYDPSGAILNEMKVVDQWYSFYWYLKMGWVF